MLSTVLAVECGRVTKEAAGASPRETVVYMRKLTRMIRSEIGAALALVALTMVVTLGMVALAVDVVYGLMGVLGSLYGI